MSEKKPPKPPMWWKNTYFWFGAILLIVGIIGIAAGPAAIRDPGQKREDSIVVWLYFVGAILMLGNGWLSHRQTIQAYHEEVGQ